MAPEQHGSSLLNSLQALKMDQQLIFSTELNEPSSLSAGDDISLTIHNNLSLPSVLQQADLHQ